MCLNHAVTTILLYASVKGESYTCFHSECLMLSTQQATATYCDILPQRKCNSATQAEQIWKPTQQRGGRTDVANSNQQYFEGAIYLCITDSHCFALVFCCNWGGGRGGEGLRVSLLPITSATPISAKLVSHPNAIWAQIWASIWDLTSSLYEFICLSFLIPFILFFPRD